MKEISNSVVLRAVESFPKGEMIMIKNIALLTAAAVLTVGAGFTASNYLGSNEGGIGSLTPVYAQETPARQGMGNMNGGGNARYGRGLDAIAEKFGMTSDELRDQLGTKTMQEIAAEKGYTTDQFHQMMADLSLQRWKDRGISDEVIAERQAAQAERRANCTGDGNYQGSPFRK